MNSGFYITGLGKEINSQEKSLENNKEINGLKEFKEKIDISMITEKNDEVILERSKHNIIDYLIREETNFSDLYKVEKYYKNLIIENSKKYDKTNKLINNKLKEIEHVQDLINREIIANIDLEKQEMVELYEIEKENLQEKINKFDHDNECYQQMFKRFYKNNYLLKKSINDLLDYEEKFEQQLNQYEIMKNKAEAAFLTRKNLLGKMRSLENMTFIKNEVELEEMQKLYHELEEQVKLIKSETLEMEYKLNLIEEDVAKKEKSITYYKQKNSALLRDRNGIIKDYLKENTKINRIYQTLNVHSIKDIIEIFNREKFNYQSNYTQFKNINKEIVDLNIIYTTYEKDLTNIANNIKHKEQQDDKITDFKQDIDVVNFEIELRETRECIEDDIDKIANMEKIVLKMKKDFILYDKKLSHIIDCINYLASLKFKDKDSKSNIINSQAIDYDGKTSSTRTLNNLVHLKDSISNESDWSDNTVKLFFKYLSRFASKLYFCFNHYLTYTASEALNKNIININVYSKSKERNKDTTIIIPLSDKLIINYYDDSFNSVGEKADKKKQVTKSDKEAFIERQKADEPKKKEVIQKKTTVTGILNNFLSDQSAYDSKIRKEDLKRSIEYKILNHVSKFTNELVEKDYLANSQYKSLTSQQSINNLPQLRNSKKYLANSTFNSAEKFYDTRASFRKSDNEMRRLFDSSSKNMDDSYFSDSEGDNKKKIKRKKLKKMNMFGKEKRDVDKFFIYKRMEDLNNLEHKFYQDKEEKQVSDTKFNFKFCNMKRQFFDEVKEKNNIKFDRFTNKEAFLKNISNENFNIILREKMNEKNFSKKDYLNELFSDNFLKENEKLLFNYLQESKKNLRNSNMDYSSTKYSTKGFYKEGNEIRNTKSSYKHLNETFKKTDSVKFNETLPHLNMNYQKFNTKAKGI